MPSEDSAQDSTSASAGMSPDIGHPGQESEVANRWVAILMRMRPGRNGKETPKGPEGHPAGVSAPEVTREEIKMPGEEENWPEEEEYEGWLSREHHQMNKDQYHMLVEPYFNVNWTLQQEKYLEDIPPHVLRIWLCVQNSYLSIRLRDVDQQLDKRHKDELMHTYMYYMKNQSDLPNAISRIKLPRSMTMKEVEADALAIFDVCLGGALERKATASRLYAFTAHRDTNPEADIQFLTQKPMLVYDLRLKEFRKARVFKLWENEQWKTWPDCN
jgi:hypothetical protein